MDQPGNGLGHGGPNGAERSLRGYVRGPTERLFPEEFAADADITPPQPDLGVAASLPERLRF